ncbi:MAG: flagellar protein [Limnochordaceae bacterium]|nr:flagellar protein [Limnochordaceae bacterium]
MDSADRLGLGPAARPGQLAGVVGQEQREQTSRARTAGTSSPASFDQLLEREIAARSAGVSYSSPPPAAVQLKWSAHAQQRLQSGEIRWGAAQEQRLAAAVEQVARKGGRETLVLLDDLAFIVSVPHRTVITAMSGARRVDNVFTQIDSAVIAR